MDKALILLQKELDKDVDDIDVWSKVSYDPKGVLEVLIGILCDKSNGLLRRIHAVQVLSNFPPAKIGVTKLDVFSYASRIMFILEDESFSNSELRFRVACFAACIAKSYYPELSPKSWRKLCPDDIPDNHNYVRWLTDRLRDILKEAHNAQ